MTTEDDRPPPIEPGERAQRLLRIADEAFTVGGYAKAQAAATLAGVYLEAAKLDRQERAEQEAKAERERLEAEFRKITEVGTVSYPLPDDGGCCK